MQFAVKEQKRTRSRSEAWLEHIALATEQHGYWHSSRRSRAALPEADLLTDQARVKALQRMLNKGQLVRDSKGCLRPAGQNNG